MLGAEKAGIKKGLVIGLGMGLFWIIVYSSFAVAFWYGMILIQKEGLEPGKIYPVSMLSVCTIEKHVIWCSTDTNRDLLGVGHL